MKLMRKLLALAIALQPIGSAALAADDGDGGDIGACYQTYRVSGQTQCNVVERRFCIGNLFIRVRFVDGGTCDG